MLEPGQRALRVFPDLAGITDEAVNLFVALARDATQERGRFIVALAGGNTPSGPYYRLGEPAVRETLPWHAIDWCFGDERCVPPDDPDSNFGMLKRTLFAHAPIPPSRIHRIEGELEPDVAAANYERDLMELFSLSDEELPRFDLILLGMGPDGHTASLFPHTSALEVTDRLVVANHVPQLNTNRITLTQPVLNNGRAVAFLVSGADKAEALSAVLEGPPNVAQYPSQAIQREGGDLIWLVDTPAAARLATQSS